MKGLAVKLFFFLLVFCPLAFGTVEPWSLAVMEISVFLALFLFLADALKNKKEVVSVPGFVPLLLFLLYILLQIIPLPAGLVKIISPAAFEIHHHSALLSGSPPSFMPVSVNIKAGLTQFFCWSACAFFYILTVQLLKDKKILKQTIVLITVFGALLAFSSILQFYLTKDMALWFRHVPDNSMIVGPYICHNHFAGLMEMIFPVVLAFFFFYRPRIHTTSVFKGIIEILSQEKANIHILIGGAALLIVSSVFVSLSRGGMLSLTLSLVFFTCLLFKRKISRGNTILIIAVVLLTGLSVSWFGWDQIFQRFEKLKNAHGIIHDSRLDFWKDSKNIIADFPVTGSGFGTFIDVYRSYQTVRGDILVDHAHNDYIELLSEGGITGFCLVALFIYLLFLKTYRMFITRKEAYCVYIYMGAVTGVVSILIHSFTDFNLQIPANRLWFFFTAGLAVSAANTGLRIDSRPTRLKVLTSPVLKKTALACITIMLTGAVAFNFSNLTGRFYFYHIKEFTAGQETPVETLETIRKISGYAAKFDPFCGTYYNASASADHFLNNTESALKNMTKAVQLNPLNSFFLKRAGLFMIQQENSNAADKLLKASVSADISNAENRLQYGVWLISQSRTDQGVGQIRQAVFLEPAIMDRALTNMSVFRLGHEKMKQAVPGLPGPILDYADFLYSYGKKEAAEETYLSALDYIEKQEKIKKWQYYKIFRFFMKTNQVKTALKVMQRAAEVLPFDPDIRIVIGDIYKKMGVIYRAEQAYEQAIFIDPDNKRAKKRLTDLNL
ncbi:MAG: O-antigen ligase family protein [Desulfobacteraceae bacterium]